MWDNWKNVTTACFSCNSQKGNRTPEEANMPLREPPYKPSFVMFLSQFSGKINKEWKTYLLY